MKRFMNRYRRAIPYDYKRLLCPHCWLTLMLLPTREEIAAIQGKTKTKWRQS